MANRQALDFEKNVARALNDAQLRKNFKFAMGNFILKRKAIFPDETETEQLRTLGNAIKQRALSRLPELLEQLEEKCTQNGIQVHWAETISEANQQVLDIMRSHGATRLVKGKSMVSEEMELNAFLQKNGIEALETDLGEFIIQLNHETPAHIIVPAIHKNRDQISKIFHDNIPDAPYTENVAELTAIARKTLRQKFYEADVGLSGVNFAVAEPISKRRSGGTSSSFSTTFSSPMRAICTRGTVVHNLPLPSFSTRHNVPVSATAKLTPLSPTSAS